MSNCSSCGKGGGYGGGYGGYAGYYGSPYGFNPGGIPGSGVGGYNYSTSFGQFGTPAAVCCPGLSDQQKCMIADKVQELIGCGKLAGVGVGVIVGGQPCFVENFGQATDECGNSINVNARFSFGTLSEVFYSVMMVEMMSRGLLRYDKHVAAYTTVQTDSLRNMKVSELGARWDDTAFANYVEWVATIGCMSVADIICKTDQTYENELENLKTIKDQVWYNTEYHAAIMVGILRNIATKVTSQPTDSCPATCPLSAEQMIEFLQTRYGFTSLGGTREGFKADQNAVLPLIRNNCGQGECLPCAPCNSCCKKSVKAQYQHKYLLCHESRQAWNLHGTMEDLLRAMEILLKGGMPEDQDCDNRTCYPDACKPFICEAALTQTFTRRYGVEIRDCNSVQRRTSVGMLWYSDTLAGNDVQFIDNFQQDGSTGIVMLDRRHCIGIAVLANTLTPSAHALAAYIYSLIMTGSCDCTLAEAEFQRVWQQQFVYINNLTCCQPAVVTGRGLRDTGNVVVPTGTWAYGVLKLKIWCTGNGCYEMSLGGCSASKVCLLAPGTFAAHLQYPDGRQRLIQMEFSGIGGNKSKLRVYADCTTREFVERNYEAINKAWGMECCAGYIDWNNSREASSCSCGPGDGVLACVEKAPCAPERFLGGRRDGPRREYMACYDSTKPLRPTEGESCPPCLGESLYYGGAGLGIDPSGEWQNFNDGCPPPVNGYGAYGYGYGFPSYYGSAPGYFPGAVAGGGCASGNCGK